MCGCIEVGACDICGSENVQLARRYYYYKIKCECCGSTRNGINVHFEIVRHCKKCVPVPPRKLSISINNEYLIH